MAAQERIHREARPSPVHTSSLQSSSVPSTPHQVARDLRFPSRSPSPTRDLSGRRSPRSATGSTPVASLPTQSAPTICKFESGAEFRKRRIPYKDGGNDPLPPPAQEPKDSLSVEDETKLTEDMTRLYQQLLPSQESDARRAKLVRKLEKILSDEWPGNDIKVNVFGSSGNLLASDDSDVDICITSSLKSLESMHSIATVLHQHGMERVVCRAAAKVPIVKIWDPELQLACDMNVNNTMALDNTRMIKTYVQLDERIRPLAKIIKYWTKQRILNDAAFGGTISSYTWICMIINFLQTRDPPVLPSLQRLDGAHRSTINGQPSAFADNLDTLKGQKSNNTDSLGSLLFHFFRYYAYELDYAQSVVSVKSGRVLSRKEKGWDVTNYQDKEARVRLCVEEPFTTNRNLGNSADDYAFSGIHQEMRRAFDLVSTGRLTECCEEFVFPPEEKPLFQRPAPRPKPTLTRSASQSGRGPSNPSNNKGQGKDSKNNRTSSSNRNSNRRASSGATYSNNRYGLTSPAMGLAGPDYFAASTTIRHDQLHEQLYKQYQYLQAQQELLRSQLLQQQNLAQMQAQAQAQAQSLGIRTQDLLTASPRQRQASGGMPNGRNSETSPATAPLLTGYLYHYPARYPTTPASPMAHARSQDGSLTLPSSPSLSSNAGSARRGKHRVNPAEGVAPASVRSQSQPGRSFPNQSPIPTLAHPGFDISSSSGTPYIQRSQAQSMLYTHQQNAFEMNHSISAGSYKYPFDPAMANYYIGQSPRMLSQMPVSTSPSSVSTVREASTALPQTSSSPRGASMRGSDTRRHSRSPSPMPDRRGSATSTHSKSAPVPRSPFLDTPQRQLEALNIYDDGPIIVNGSTQRAVPAMLDPVSPFTIVPPSCVALAQENGHASGVADSASTTPHGHQDADHSSVAVDHPKEQGVTTPPVSTNDEAANGSSHKKAAPLSEPSSPVLSQASRTTKPSNPWHSGVSLTAALRARPPPPLNLVLTKSNEEAKTSSEHKKLSQPSPSTAPPPLLSPVAEMRTPSPVSSRGLASPRLESTKLNGHKAAQAANGKLNEKIASVGTPKTPVSANALMPDNPQLAFQRQPLPVSGPQTASEWQQATRKHRKAKSQGITTALKEAGVTTSGPTGDERKGG